MPRLLIVSGPDHNQSTILDEHIDLTIMDNPDEAVPILERVAWAIANAERKENGGGQTTPLPSL